MTTSSYPRTNTNFDGGEWRDIFDGQTGIVGADGTPATCGDLSLSSVSDTATIATKLRVWYRGYVLEVTADHGMTLAAVTGSAKTYSVGVMFDPTNETTNPLTLYSALKSAITVPLGGSFLTLFEVTRQPSQTLNLAAVVDFRRYLGPAIVVAAGTRPADAPLGTRLWDGGDQYARVRNATLNGALWVSLTNPAWTNMTLSASFTAGSTVPAWRINGGRLEFSGSASKAGGGTFTTAPVTIGYVGAGAAPAHFTRVPVSGGGVLADLEIYGNDSSSPGRVDVHFYVANTGSGVNLAGSSMAIR